MSLRTSLQKLIRRDPVISLRERAAELQARIPAPKPQTAPHAEASVPAHAEQVAQAGLIGDVLAVSGIDHRDGTVSYADATGKVGRRPMARWVAFNATQMLSRIQAEIGPRRVTEANPLPAEEHAAWESKIRQELRADAVAALTLYPERAFKAEQDRRTGAEPTTAEGRAQTDAMLLALAPEWEAARDAYAGASQRQLAVTAAAEENGWPGPAPEGAHSEWQAWFQRAQEWRERTGVIAAEEASGEAGTDLFRIEEQIADLSAATLAGLKLKARVAQRSDDIEVDWPEKLGAGLVRDILAFTEAQARQPTAAAPSLVDMLDLASATMGELQAVDEVAERIGSVAYAHAWSALCRRGENKHGAPYFNAAGDLVQWIGDALTAVETAVHEEARRRTPAASTDREARLSLLAATTIDNGDPDETEGFARELLAHAEAEREGR